MTPGADRARRQAAAGSGTSLLLMKGRTMKNNRRGPDPLVRRLTDWTASTAAYADYGDPTWCANVDQPGGHSIEKHATYCADCRARMPELLAARDAREKRREELRAEYEERRQAALKGARR